MILTLFHPEQIHRVITEAPLIPNTDSSQEMYATAAGILQFESGGELDRDVFYQGVAEVFDELGLVEWEDFKYTYLGDILIETIIFDDESFVFIKLSDIEGLVCE